MSYIRKITRTCLWLVLLAGTGSTLVLASAYLYLSPNLPSVDVLRDIKLQTPLRIYSADQQLIGEFGEKRSIPIKYEQIPSQFINALLSAEDDDFYGHHGVSIKGLLRAASQLLLTGQKSSGGSTITMQVARNYFLSFERTFSRKFNEILLSLQIERELSKGQILELYANIIFLGHRAYGFEAAAYVYYGKSLNALSLPQLAMIAGLPKAPSTFNPLVNQSRALVRRNWILGRMKKLGHIDQEAYQEAVAAPITATFHGTRLAMQAPYIAEMARQEVLQQFGNSAYTDGYKVYTTVDSQLQQSAQVIVGQTIVAYDKRHGYRGPERQLIATDPDEDAAAQLSRRLAVLQPLRPIQQLHPAVVTALGPQTFSALLAPNKQVRVEWDTGIKHLRPFINTDRRGARPVQAADIVAVDDLVRLRQTASGHWQLSQLPEVQAALVSLDASNGAIRSLVGGFDFRQSKFNRVTQATRQPGSNFKPFIYTAALANGYTAASIINDAAIVFEDDSLESAWRPTNDTGKFYGPTRLRYALTKSRNMVSIRLLRALGIRKAIDYIARFGFDARELPRDLSLALGSHSVRPLQIVTAYAAIANGGYRVAPFLITRIENIDGDNVYQANPDTAVSSSPQATPVLEQEEATIEDILQGFNVEPEPEPSQAQRIIEPRIAYIIDSMLKDVVNNGTAKKALALERYDIAGKTGTTNGPTDAWFSGYGGGIATTVWVGFDKNNLLGNNEFGSTSALPAWVDYMRQALAGVPQRVQVQPPGVISVKIDPDTGLLARPGQKSAIFEVFRQEMAPSQLTDNSGRGGKRGTTDEASIDDLF